jgi:hypothetical protein
VPPVLGRRHTAFTSEIPSSSVEDPNYFVAERTQIRICVFPSGFKTSEGTSLYHTEKKEAGHEELTQIVSDH